MESFCMEKALKVIKSTCKANTAKSLLFSKSLKTGLIINISFELCNKGCCSPFNPRGCVSTQRNSQLPNNRVGCSVWRFLYRFCILNNPCGTSDLGMCCQKGNWAARSWHLIFSDSEAWGAHLSCPCLPSLGGWLLTHGSWAPNVKRCRDFEIFLLQQLPGTKNWVLDFWACFTKQNQKIWPVLEDGLENYFYPKGSRLSELGSLSRVFV